MRAWEGETGRVWTGRGGKLLEGVSWGEGGLLPQDVLVGGGQVFLGGQHFRGELAGTQATGAAKSLAARTPDVAQNGKGGESDWVVMGRGEGGSGRTGRSGSGLGDGGGGGGEGGSEGLAAAQEGTNLSVNIKLSRAGTGGGRGSRGGGGSGLGCKAVRGVMDGSGGVVDGTG